MRFPNTMLAFYLLSIVALAGDSTARIGVQPVGQDAVLFDTGEESSVWVGGSNYKARFDSTGATFTPFLGVDVPRSFPVRFALGEVWSGNVELDLDRGCRPELNHERVCFDRAGVRELYDVDFASLRQSFELDALPTLADQHSAGGLVLVVEFESELQARREAEGVSFLGPFGGVHYGEATVYDAKGLESDAPIQLCERGIEIAVSADFLAQAEFPILVDPLITTLAIDATAFEDSLPDVAYDASLDVHVVVWQRRFSQSDHDVHGQVLDGAGKLVREFAIDLTDSDRVEPKVAGIEALDRFLVTYRGENSGISGRLLDLSGVFSLGAPVFYVPNALNHDLGGDSGEVAPYSFCIVVGAATINCRNFDWRLVDADGTPGGWYYTGDCDTEAVNPKIANNAESAPGLGRRWAVAWGNTFSFGHPNVAFAMIDPASPSNLQGYVGVYGGGFNATNATMGVSSRLEDANGDGAHLVVWTSTPDAGGNATVRGSVVRSGGLVTGEHELGPDSSSSYPYAAVDSDGSSFVVAMSEESSGGSSNTMVVGTFDLVESDLNRTEVVGLTTPDDATRRPALTSTRNSGAGAPQRFLAVWDEVDASNEDIAGAIYDSAGPGTPFCTGAQNSAGTSASIGALGSKSLTMNDFQLQVSAAAPNRPGMFYLGLAEVELPFGEGFRCIGGVTRRIVPILTTDGSGGASLQLDFNQLYADLVQPGAPPVRYQFWYRDPSGGPAGFNLSNALRVEHLP